MNTATRNTVAAVVVLVAALFVFQLAASGNSGIPTSALTRDEAVEMVTNHLDGYNQRDYAAFSRDFHPSLREGITEDAFQAFHDSAMDRIGPYESIQDVELQWGTMSGVVVWVATVDFEHEAGVEVRLAFRPDGRQIEGTRFLARALEG